MKHLRLALWVCVAIAVVGFIFINLPQEAGETTTSSSMIPPAGFNQGAPFTLIDHNGDVFNSTERIAEGQYGLFFFGFTFCPVICPTELQKFSDIMDQLPTDVASKVTPVFITIDPERDTPQVLKDYVAHFHPSLIGVTGDVDKVHQVLNEWKVYYNKVDDPSLSEYTMDHSTYAYLVNHDMQIVALYRMNATAGQIADNISSIIKP